MSGARIAWRGALAAALLGACTPANPPGLTFERPPASRWTVAEAGARLHADDGRTLWAVAPTVARVQLDGTWRDAALTADVGLGDDGVVRWTWSWPSPASDVAIGGLLVRFRVQPTPAPADVRMTQLGYAKYSPPGVVELSGPPAVRSDGALPLRLHDPRLGLEPILAGITVDPAIAWWTTVVRLHPELPLLGVGACAADRWQTRLSAGPSGAALEIVVQQGGLGSAVTVPAGTALAFEPVCMAAGTELDAVDAQMAAAYTPAHAPPEAQPAAAAPRFFSTWHADFPDVSLTTIAAELEALGREGYLGPIDAFQIDDGYQRAWGDWLPTAPSFGGTLSDAVDLLRDHGLRPGLWLTPSLVAPDSAVARRHPEWLLRDDDGRVVTCGACSLPEPELWALDWSHPQVAPWMTDVLHAMQDLGVELFKIDFLVYSAADGVAYDRNTTALDRYHTMLRTVRAAMRPGSLVWSATYPLLPTLGALHGYRVSGDLGFPFFDDLPVGHRYHYLRALTTRGTWLGAFGWIDPDGMFARAQPRGNRTEALAAMAAMAGGMYSLGERPADLGPDLRPDRLPAPLRDAIGNRRPFVAADPFAHIVEPWSLFQSQEVVFGYDRHRQAQSSTYLRERADGIDVLVFNLSAVAGPVAVDLRPALRRLRGAGAVEIFAADGAALMVEDAMARPVVAGLGYALLRVEPVP